MATNLGGRVGFVDVHVAEFELGLPAARSAVHVSTTCACVDPAARPSGSTTWACSIGRSEAVLSWQWHEALPGVPILSDPNALASNICFVDGGGEITDPQRATTLLNAIVHGIDWQATVRAEANRQLQRPPAGSSGVH